MDYKLPYYMAYPMPLEYDDERKERRDIEYMKTMYPDEVKRILPFVEDECDRMEYEGSMMYDEHPDMLSVRRMCSRVCDRIREIGMADMEDGEQSDTEMEMQQRRSERGRNWNLREIVEVLLLHEMMRRRAEHRRQRRHFYPGF